MTGNSVKYKEGILGESGEFPWLGVLRIPMKQESQPSVIAATGAVLVTAKHVIVNADVISRASQEQEDQPSVIAATGAILVTAKHVIVNADDISRASQDRLRTAGSVYFVPEFNKTWSSKVKDFIFHPEYEYATLNTLALVELDTDVEYDDEQYRAVIKPICWPGIAFNTSNALYVAGFTDGKGLSHLHPHVSFKSHFRPAAPKRVKFFAPSFPRPNLRRRPFSERMLLEKILYKAQYVPRSICDEFYKRKYLKEDKMQEPKNYVCTSGVNRKQSCQWDNGMVLLSNVTGHWTIVGFGVAGPGCSAPTRFLDMSAYIDWIQTSSRDPQTYDYYGGRQIDTTY